MAVPSRDLEHAAAHGNMVLAALSVAPRRAWIIA